MSILDEMCILLMALRSNKVSRRAGLDVRLADSGSSIDQPGYLTKGGNTYLQAALHISSLSQVHHDARAQAYYETLIAKGKGKVSDLSAVRRKMQTGLWACMYTNEPFDSAKLFTIDPEKA